jgi:hypothetical protein
MQMPTAEPAWTAARAATTTTRDIRRDLYRKYPSALSSSACAPVRAVSWA